MLAHTCDPGTWETVAEEPQSKGSLDRLHRKLLASLSYTVRFYLKGMRRDEEGQRTVAEHLPGMHKDFGLFQSTANGG